MESKTSAQKANISELVNITSELDSKYLELVDQDSTLEAKISALEIKLANSHGTNAGFQVEISDLKDRLYRVEQSNSDQSNKMLTLEETIRTLQESNSELTDKNNEYDIRNQEMMNQIELIVARLPEIQRQANVSETSSKLQCHEHLKQSYLCFELSFNIESFLF